MRGVEATVRTGLLSGYPSNPVDCHSRRRRVPLAEVYSSIAVKLHVAHTDENEGLGVEVAPDYGGVGV